MKTFSNLCLRVSERKAKHLDATTMFTYSHANTPIGQSERAYYLSYFIKELDEAQKRLQSNKRKLTLDTLTRFNFIVFCQITTLIISMMWIQLEQTWKSNHEVSINLFPSIPSSWVRIPRTPKGSLGSYLTEKTCRDSWKLWHSDW